MVLCPMALAYPKPCALAHQRPCTGCEGSSKIIDQKVFMRCEFSTEPAREWQLGEVSQVPSRAPDVFPILRMNRKTMSAK